MRWSEKELNKYLEDKQIKNACKDKTKQPLKNTNPITINYDKEQKLIKIVINIPPVTKKNHGRIISYGKTCPQCKKKEYVKLIPSKQYSEYEAQVKSYIELINKNKPINYPINLKCLFYRKANYKSDLTGYLQAIQDVLVSSNIIEDDNCNIVVSTDGSRVLYDKNNPRTEIEIKQIISIQKKFLWTISNCITEQYITH